MTIAYIKTIFLFYRGISIWMLKLQWNVHELLSWWQWQNTLQKTTEGRVYLDSDPAHHSGDGTKAQGAHICIYSYLVPFLLSIHPEPQSHGITFRTNHATLINNLESSSQPYPMVCFYGDFKSSQVSSQIFHHTTLKASAGMSFLFLQREAVVIWGPHKQATNFVYSQCPGYGFLVTVLSSPL